MSKKIYCNGKNWTNDEYIERVSAENRFDEEIDAKIEPLEKEINKLEKERRQGLRDIWK